MSYFQKSSQKNVLLNPILDHIKTIVDYDEISLLMVDGDDAKTILCQGMIPLTVDVLSINWTTSELCGMDENSQSRVTVFNNYQPKSKLIKPIDGNWTGDYPFKCGMTIPIAHDNRLIGMLFLEHTQLNYYSPEMGNQVQGYLQSEIKNLEAGMILAEELQRAAEIDCLFEVQNAITSHLNQKDFLNLVVTKAKQISNAQNAYLFLCDGQVCSLAAADQLVPTGLCPGSRFSVRDIFIADTNSISMQGIINNPFNNKVRSNFSSSTSNLAVSIYLQDRPEGFILVTDKILGKFGSPDKRVLTLMALMAGNLLQKVDLYRQAHYVATLEERDRLSRELHDDLAQKLAYFKMETDVVKRYTRENDSEKAISHLTMMESAIDETCSNLREEIFTLREVIQPRDGFLDSLMKYLDNYRAKYGLNVTLVNCAEVIPSFSSDEVVQISRIIQEALTNVRKHAQASHVDVHLQNQMDSFIIQIKDNGIGFYASDLSEDTDSHFGTLIMRERAECIGGELQIDSSPSLGTAVSIKMSSNR